MDIKIDNEAFWKIHNNEEKLKRLQSLESIITNLLQNLNVTRFEWDYVSKIITCHYDNLSENIELPKLKETE